MTRDEMGNPDHEPDELDEETLSEEELARAELPEEDTLALRVMVEELREAPPPDLAWDQIEHRLMTAIDGRDADRPTPANETKAPPGGTVIRLQWVAMVAAAAAVLLFAWSRQPAAPPSPRADAPSKAPAAPATPAPGPSRTDGVDLSALPKIAAMGGEAYAVLALAPAARVVAQDSPLRFGIEGVVAWTLAPGGEVVVDTTAVPHTIRLLRGHVDAEVNPDRPGQPVEAFAVIAGQTRVTVRGTVFSVTRSADRVAVSVSRGKVAVGGVAEGSPSELLESPAKGEFDLTAGRRLASADDPKPVDTTPDEPTAKATPAAPKSPAHLDPPAGPSAAAPTALSVAQAQSRVTGCLRTALGKTEAGEAVVSISSQVTVVTSPQGDITAVRFNPPLRPDLQQTCGGLLFDQKIAPPGTASFAVQLSSAR